jgi:hypothetical protein
MGCPPRGRFDRVAPQAFSDGLDPFAVPLLHDSKLHDSTTALLDRVLEVLIGHASRVVECTFAVEAPKAGLRAALLGCETRTPIGGLSSSLPCADDYEVRPNALPPASVIAADALDGGGALAASSADRAGLIGARHERTYTCAIVDRLGGLSY